MEKPRRSKVVAATVLAASVGAASVLGHEEKHIELREASPDTMAAICLDAGIISTATIATTTSFFSFDPPPDD